MTGTVTPVDQPSGSTPAIVHLELSGAEIRGGGFAELSPTCTRVRPKPTCWGAPRPAARQLASRSSSQPGRIGKPPDRTHRHTQLRTTPRSLDRPPNPAKQPSDFIVIRRCQRPDDDFVKSAQEPEMSNPIVATSITRQLLGRFIPLDTREVYSLRLKG